MAKVVITFVPAHLEISGDVTFIVREFAYDKIQRHCFEATSAKEIRAEVDRLGATKTSMTATVRIVDGSRKPRGFDALLRNLDYNLVQKAAVA